jgi:hypothetical protein
MPRLNSPSTGTPASTVSFGTIETGYLSRVNGVLHIQTMQTVTDAEGKESRQSVPVEFADFDIRAKHVVREADGFTWIVDIVPRGYIGTPPEDQLTSAVLANVPKLDAWLASHGVSYGEPTTGSVMHRFKPGTRLMRYIKAQRPPLAEIRPQTGYHADLDMFLTTRGAILPGEIEFDNTVPFRPAAMLRHNTASPFTYGFAHQGLEEVREVLREVLGFHDETATALFASWAVMSLIQSALQPGYVDHFPVFAVEAPSGTGKTTGALGMLGEMLTGYSMGESQSTHAALRDMLASTWSGFVHIDDLDDPKNLFEMLRMVTANGTQNKKTGQGWDKNAQIQMTGALYITGEHLGMDTEKALMDRVIQIGLPSPIHRKSRRPGREHLSQAQDMKEIQRRYQMLGGLSSISATVISEVMMHVEQIRHLVDTLRVAPGRQGDKYAVVLAGARMIDGLLGEEGAWEGEGPTSYYVNHWVEQQLDQRSFEGDNSLTTEVIPTVGGLGLQTVDSMGKCVDMFRGIPVPFPPCGIAEIAAFEGERLFIQLTILANVWEALKGAHNVKQRTETRKALEQQAKAAGFVKTANPVRLPGRRDLAVQRLWVAPESVTEAMRERLGR